ncbi:sigma-70 family RNA polymerase sigma factor [Kitasatospora sp. KL5]|uniref:sigma-70 family RNA polymerase sigma factor n=1 Tax=Kitasatospora sp. KL5 TaxID=3425125 RepID=UPI003D6F1E48
MSKPPVPPPVSPVRPPATAAGPGQDRPTLGHDALAELHHLHSGYLLRALVRVTGDRGKAEDILQETLLRAWQNPAALASGPEQARPWLLTVARRIAIDHYRMAAARAREVMADTPEDRPLAEDPYDGVVASRDLARAMAVLPPHHREVLVELHLNDRSVAETAELLGVPPGTVKSRNFYAVRALRPVLAAQPGYAPPEERAVPCGPDAASAPRVGPGAAA